MEQLQLESSHSCPNKISKPSYCVFICLLSLAGLTSCMVGPDYTRPATDTSTQWLNVKELQLSASSADNKYWWKSFNDPVLNELIERAFRENLSIRSAGARIFEARAQLSSAIGNLYPQNQQLFGSLDKVRLSQRATQAAFARIFDYNQAQLGITASWELDFWGRFRRAIESADANFQAVVADYDNALVSLTADVAQTYITIRTLEKRLGIAHQNAQTQTESLRIAEIRYKGGTTSERDVEQARTVLANTQASIPLLEASLRQQFNALSILLGKSPRKENELITRSRDIPAPPPQLAVGIPADLLRRRPDIRQAEFLAAAQSANIGVTKADLYPAFSLSGTFGLLSTDVGAFALKDIFSWKSRTATFGPAVQWNIFNYGQITNQVRAQDARLQALLTDYQNAVINAQREVEDRLAAFMRSQERASSLGVSTASAQRSLALASLQYREGITDFTTVLTAQQAVLSEQDSLASTLGDIAGNYVGIYRALGGGWRIREGKDILPADVRQQMAKRTNWGSLLKVNTAPPVAESPQSSTIAAPKW